MAITLGAAMRREWSKPTRFSFSTSLVGTASLEPGNDTAVIRDASVRVWQQAALNALTGNSSVGSFGMDEQKVPEKGIKASTPPTLRNFSLKNQKELDAFLKNIQ